MVEIADIRDEDSLKAWLQKLPFDEREARRVAVMIAHRAAMRVLPIWWNWVTQEPRQSNEADLSPLLILRCALVSGVPPSTYSPRIREAANWAASNCSKTAGAIGVTAAAFAASTAAGAANVVASRAKTLVGNATANCAAAVHSFAFEAAESTDADALFWGMIRDDCQVATEHTDILARSLWHDAENPLEAEWTGVRQRTTEPEWRFWRGWYQDALDGSPPDRKLLERIALIDPEIWEAGPEAVNAQIARIKAENRQENEQHDPTDIGSALIALPAPAPKTVAAVREVMQRNRAELPPTYGAIEALILLEIERLQHKNYQNDDEPAEAKRQIGVFLALHSAIVGMRGLIPASGEVTDAEAMETLGLWQLYKTKFAELPRAKADEVVEGAWETTKATVQFGLIAGSAYLATLIGVTPQIGLPVAALCFAPKKAGEIIKTAKEAFWRKSD